MNLATGATTLVGTTGNSIAARDLAVAAATSVVTAYLQPDLAADFSLYPVTSSTRFAFTPASTGQVGLGVFDALGRRAVAPTTMLPRRGA